LLIDSLVLTHSACGLCSQSGTNSFAISQTAQVMSVAASGG
jgi:hypothetical protein